MIFYQNHCWCNRSIWDNERYYSRHMVMIEECLRDAGNIYGYGDGAKTIEPDWKNLIYTKDVSGPLSPNDMNIIQKHTEKMVERGRSFEEIAEYTNILAEHYATNYNVPHLNQEVIDWLNENTQTYQRSENTHAWAIGNDDYRSRDTNSLTIWFERKIDAMKFIRTWSSHKKPTTYFNYFKDDRRYLDLKSNKLIPA